MSRDGRERTIQVWTGKEADGHEGSCAAKCRPLLQTGCSIALLALLPQACAMGGEASRGLYANEMLPGPRSLQQTLNCGRNAAFGFRALSSDAPHIRMRAPAGTCPQHIALGATQKILPQAASVRLRAKHAGVSLSMQLPRDKAMDAKETEVEDPEALEATRRLTLAWLRSTFSVEPDAWTQSRAALRDGAAAIATITRGNG